MVAEVGPITSFQHAGANSAEQHYDMNIATFLFGNNIDCIKSWTFVGKTASDAVSTLEAVVTKRNSTSTENALEVETAIAELQM